MSFTLRKSLGEYRVDIGFNPTSDPHVTELQQIAADFIDACESGQELCGNDPEISRLWELALTHAEEAAMWGVKALTKRRR